MLLVFAYMNGIYSSREIEKACRNDITDTLTLILFLERIQPGRKRKYENIIADSGYASEEIIHILNSRDKKHILNRLIMRSGRKRSLRMTDTESRICIIWCTEVRLCFSQIFNQRKTQDTNAVFIAQLCI